MYILSLLNNLNIKLYAFFLVFKSFSALIFNSMYVYIDNKHDEV
jgi:hypothetical protein